MSFSPSLSVITSVFRGENYLKGFFENVQNQTIFPELEVVLVLNEPNAVEKRLASDFAARHTNKVQVLTVAMRETLGASWNRGWGVTQAPYVALWNIDDRRTVDSLQRQLGALEQGPASVLCYGDYVAVPAYGAEDGERRSTPRYLVRHFARSFAQGGAFWVARRELYGTVGPFDEQFRVGPDMELSFRIAARGLKMIRCDGLLGFFTDAAQGLSTREGAKDAAVERTAIQLRYGVFDKVRPELVDAAKRYRLDEVLAGAKWIPLATYLPNHQAQLAARQPLWMLGRVRNSLRGLFARIGLLDTLYKWQQMLFKREI